MSFREGCVKLSICVFRFLGRDNSVKKPQYLLVWVDGVILQLETACFPVKKIFPPQDEPKEDDGGQSIETHYSESNKPRILETSDLGYFGKNHEKSSKIMVFDDKITKKHDRIIKHHDF